MTSATPAPVAPSQAAAGIPYKRDNGAMGAAIQGGGVGILVISLLVIAVVLWLRRRFNLASQAGQPRALRVIESARLGPRALLSVVEFDGARYLLAQSEHGITCLAEKAALPEQKEMP
jgi:flagellar biosynthetic protein FliO